MMKVKDYRFTMVQPLGRRTPLEIVADILRLLRLGITGKLEITCTAKLGRQQTSSYLDWLLEKGLLEETEREIGIPSYRITPKGLSLLAKIEDMREMLPPDGTLDFLHRSKLIEIEIPGKPEVESSEIEKD